MGADDVPTSPADESEPPVHDWSRLLLHITIGLWCLAVPAWWILQAYYNVSITTLLSFTPDDGWCDVQTAALGVHCFGDYALPVQFIQQGSPWATPGPVLNPYPAIAMWPFAAANSLGAAFNSPRLALIVYLIALSCCVLVPAAYAMSKRSS